MEPDSFSLGRLLEPFEHHRLGPAEDPLIRGLVHDSRKAGPGALFVAIKGHKQDGHDHAERAVKAGAAAVLTERPLPLAAPQAVVPSVAKILSPLAARFHGHPSRGMTVAGVTGTNGKTTVTYMLESIFRRAGRRCGVVGTINYRWEGREEKAPNTTPLALDLQELLRRMRDDGVTHAAMEVSSHALALGRADDVAFSVAVFTNLTRDHLDFHRDMNDYFAAKARLFDLLAAAEGTKFRCAIINQDDPWSEKLISRVKTKVLTYGLKGSPAVSAEAVSLSADGTSFTLAAPEGRAAVRMRPVGAHNVSNALAAAGAALAVGATLEAVREGLESLPGVPGRLERVAASRPLPFDVFVDYAHTDDALKNVLDTLRPLAKNKLIAVFGCGGDRDRTKRPLMGEVAAKKADRVIVTSDNPRSEEPAKITLDIEVGLRRTGFRNYEIVLDRAAAIEKALGEASAGDVILIAGKGHETYQIFADRTVDFDDRIAARHVLEKLAAGTARG
jgi:UDP-N-acetylmuramoyl-L-alanyl-D-glutamate--2,6-diaminopimelate ligase